MYVYIVIPEFLCISALAVLRHSVFNFNPFDYLMSHKLILTSSIYTVYALYLYIHTPIYLYIYI